GRADCRAARILVRARRPAEQSSLSGELMHARDSLSFQVERVTISSDLAERISDFRSGQHTHESPRVVWNVGFLPLTGELRGELVGIRLHDGLEQMLQAVFIRLEVFCHLIEQPRIARLDRPRFRRRIVRIEAQQIETVVRFDKTNDHQLAPNQIHGSAAELDVARSDPSQLLSRIDAGTRLLARQYESWFVRSGLWRESRFRHGVDGL